MFILSFFVLTNAILLRVWKYFYEKNEIACSHKLNTTEIVFNLKRAKEKWWWILLFIPFFLLSPSFCWTRTGSDDTERSWLVRGRREYDKFNVHHSIWWIWACRTHFLVQGEQGLCTRFILAKLKFTKQTRNWKSHRVAHKWKRRVRVGGKERQKWYCSGNERTHKHQKAIFSRNCDTTKIVVNNLNFCEAFTQ